MSLFEAAFGPVVGPVHGALMSVAACTAVFALATTVGQLPAAVAEALEEELESDPLEHPARATSAVVPRAVRRSMFTIGSPRLLRLMVRSGMDRGLRVGRDGPPRRRRHRRAAGAG